MLDPSHFLLALDLSWAAIQAWPWPMIVTLGVLVGIIIALYYEKIAAELIMLAALLVLVCCQVIPMKEALSGFANETIFTIAGLLVVGTGLQTTGAIEFISRALLGRPRKGTPLLRLITPVAGLSAFMNNTPLVAFFLPIFVHLSRKLRTSPSKLLIPLSYASIMGGTCTLIGTSTNFVIDSAFKNAGMPGMGMWELAWIGIPVSIVGLIYISTIGQRLLPDRRDILEYAESHRREYTVELIVRPSCSLIGMTIRKSGLRDLPGLYLYAIERGGERLSPVDPEQSLKLDDILCFSGVVSTILDAQKIRGLEPLDHHENILPHPAFSDLPAAQGLPSAAPRSGNQLCEAVVSPSSPLVGMTVKEADFRTRYHASIMAVHRSGEKIERKIGQIVLQSGDTLLVDAPEDFIRRWRNSRDFILVSGIEDSAPIDHHRAWIALLIFAGVVLGMTLQSNHAALIALIGAALTVLTGCTSSREANRSIDLPVLILIAAALGVSKALDKSGAAEWVANHLISWAEPFGKVYVLAVVVLLTGVLTELLSNNACAAIMGALAFATAKNTEMDPRPLLLAVAVTSSYGFATPLGYQTNLMVYGPGGYKFRDYLRIGIPLDIICWTMTIVIVSLLWKLDAPLPPPPLANP
jgi:di/tricarboxylate transporter